MIMKSKFNVQCITPSQMNLIYNTRLYLKRLLIWTRAYIIGSYTGTGTAEDLFGRLYIETEDFGDLIHAFFGLGDSNEYTQLLNQFTFRLRDLISAQLAGDIEAVNKNVNLLYQNNRDRAAFLASINPYFDEIEWKNMLDTYLQYIIEEANLFASGDYSTELEIFNRLIPLADKMGDYYAQSLYYYIVSCSQNENNIPLQDSQKCLTYEQINEIYNIRTTWFNLVIWVRNLMQSKYRGIGDIDVVAARLKQVPDESITSMRQFFDNPILNDYELQLNAYIGLIDALTTAQMEGKTDEIQRITNLLYQNASDRAASLASLNPSYWNKNELQYMLINNLRNTIEESTTFLNQDYARNLDIFSTLLDQTENMSDYIAQGLVSYIISQQPK